jgi:hypothetical protein
MDVSKGEIYFRDKLSKITSKDSIFNTELNLLILEWIEASLKNEQNLMELTPLFLSFRDIIFDVIWLLSQTPSCLPALATILRNIILYDPLSLSKLAIERLDPDLLEQAGVITMMNYKFHKNFFIETCPRGFSEVLMLFKASPGQKSKNQKEEHWVEMRREFLRLVGKWELDLYRVIDLVLIENELHQFYPFLKFCGVDSKVFRQVFKIKFKILWKFQRLEEPAKISDFAIEEALKKLILASIEMVKQGLFATIKEIEEISWPLTSEESLTELNEWKTDILKGKVVDTSGQLPFYDPQYEYAKLNAHKIRNQRAFLYFYLQRDPDLFASETDRLINEESYLRYFIPVNDNSYSIGEEDETLPSLFKRISMNGPMPNLHEILWDKIKKQPYEQRFTFYNQWDELTDYDLAYSKQLSRTSVKRFLRRLSRDNVRQYGRLLGKISHSNPVTVLNLLIDSIMVYDNLIQPVIESLRYLTVLEFDILTFCILSALQLRLDTADQGLRPDGYTLSPWLVNLASFAGALFKRYGSGLGELGAWLDKLHWLMGEEKKFVVLVFFQELLEQMAGIPSPENFTLVQSVLYALPSLEPVTQLAKVHAVSINGSSDSSYVAAAKRLFQAIKARDLVLKIFTVLDQLREWLLSPETPYLHVKVINDFSDKCICLMLQYVHFLKSQNFYQSDSSESSCLSFNGQCILSRLEEVNVNEYSQFDICEFYEQEVKSLLNMNISQNDKLKLKLLQEEYENYQNLPKSPEEDTVSLDSAEKRCLVSMADAVFMSQIVNMHGNYDFVKKLTERASQWLPYFTSWEVHNYAEFLSRIISKAHKEEQDLDRPGEEGTKGEGIDASMEHEGQFSSDYLPLDQPDSSSNVTPVSSMSQLVLEDGELTKPNSTWTNELLDTLLKVVCELFQSGIETEADEEEDGECDYVLKRNLLITVWRHRNLIGKGAVIENLLQFLEKMKNTEEREDLKVLSTRIYLELSNRLGLKREEPEIPPEASQIEESKPKEKKKSEAIEKKRKASEPTSPSQKKIKSEEKPAPPSSGSQTPHSGTTSTYYRDRHHDYYGSSSTGRRDHRDHREYYESSSGSYYRGSSSRWHQPPPR